MYTRLPETLKERFKKRYGVFGSIILPLQYFPPCLALNFGAVWSSQTLNDEYKIRSKQIVLSS